MSNMHIFRAPDQPATKFKTEFGVIRNAPRSLAFCVNCHKRRWVKNMRVQVYYDGIRYFCSPGHGCKAKKGVKD
jgi:hypothetical protein